MFLPFIFTSTLERIRWRKPHRERRRIGGIVLWHKTRRSTDIVHIAPQKREWIIQAGERSIVRRTKLARDFLAAARRNKGSFQVFQKETRWSVDPFHFETIWLSRRPEWYSATWRDWRLARPRLEIDIENRRINRCGIVSRGPSSRTTENVGYGPDRADWGEPSGPRAPCC